MTVAAQPLCGILSSFEAPHLQKGSSIPPQHGLRTPPGLSCDAYQGPNIFIDHPVVDTSTNYHPTDYNRLTNTQTHHVPFSNHTEDEDLEWEKAVAEAFLGMSNEGLDSALPKSCKADRVPTAHKGSTKVGFPFAQDSLQNAQLDQNDQSVQKVVSADRSKKGKPGRPNAQPSQWWRECPMEQICALSGFPICLLPYPPFKFRQDPNRPEHFQLVDGKYLVLQAIASARFEACGRPLLRSDVNALDTYIRRCNLGPLRPGSAAELQHAAASAQTPEQCAAAEQEFSKLQERAKSEWKRLQRIQDQRLSEMRKRNNPAFLGPSYSGVEQSMSMPLGPNKYYAKENHYSSRNPHPQQNMGIATRYN